MSSSIKMSETASDDFIMVQDAQSDGQEEEQEDEILGFDDSMDAGPSTLSRDKFQAKRAPLQRHGVACKLCLEEIRGERWMCVDCNEWSLCSLCFHGVSEDVHPKHTFVRVHSATDIYAPSRGEFGHIATPVIHLGVVCSSCQFPILGCRYECIADECENKVNLCQSCETLPLQAHKSSHPMIFYKIRKETSANSAILEYAQQSQQKSRNVFGGINRPEQISNKGLWELDGLEVVSEKSLRARKELSMEIERDKETPWGTHLAPNATFARSWEVINCGTRAWPKGTFVTRVSPAIFTPLHFKKRIVSDDVVRRGKKIEIRFVGLTAPEAPRTYVEVWALCDSEDRFFGERLEIRICVGEEDEHASDRYYGLSDALGKIKEAKEDLKREKEGEGALEPCRMQIHSSTMQWHGKEQSLTCTWDISNHSKTRFPSGCQLRRTRRTTGNSLYIDDSEVTVSVPQGLEPAQYGQIMIENLKVMPKEADIDMHKTDDQVEGKAMKEIENTNNISNWFTDTWKLVDGHGTEFGEKLTFAQSFQSTDLELKARAELEPNPPSVEKLWPDGSWKGKGDWLYRSSIDDGKNIEE